MQKKEIEKIYIKKINELKKHNKAYFQNDNPLISDKKYDDIKEEVFSINKIWNKLIDSNELFGIDSVNNFVHVSTLEIYNNLNIK